jgi:hypothetical protein
VLQKKLGFQGLIFTDALNMKAVSKFSTPGQIDLRFSGGERCFIISEDVPLALDFLEKPTTILYLLIVDSLHQ